MLKAIGLAPPLGDKDSTLLEVHGLGDDVGEKNHSI
jgi:hypothetical protein